MEIRGEVTALKQSSPLRRRRSGDRHLPAGDDAQRGEDNDRDGVGGAQETMAVERLRYLLTQLISEGHPQMLSPAPHHETRQQGYSAGDRLLSRNMSGLCETRDTISDGLIQATEKLQLPACRARQPSHQLSCCYHFFLDRFD